MIVLLIVFALVLFLIAGSLPVTEPWRIRFTALGLAALTAALLITHGPGLLLR